MPQDGFERVLAALHKAALGDVEWASAAALVDDLIGAHGHSLVYGALGPGGEPEIHMARFFLGQQRRKDLEHLYFHDYYWRDEAIPRLYGLCDGELVHKSNLYTDQEKKTSAAYNEFRSVNKTQDGLFMGLDGLDGCGILWSFGNSTEREGWGHDQIRRIRRLAPHIRHFARVRRAMADADALGASLAELLVNGRAGFVELDRHGRILEANDLAREILLQRDGLLDEDGVLGAKVEKEDERLRLLLARALPRYGLPRSGGSIRITRAKKRAPLVCEIHPVRRMVADHHAWRVAALVLVIDPAAPPQVDPELVAAALGLTPMEAQVAVALAGGGSVIGVACSLGCARNTVKTHLKHIYRKLGLRKQTELVRMVLSLEDLRLPPRSGVLRQPSGRTSPRRTITPRGDGGGDLRPPGSEWSPTS